MEEGWGTGVIGRLSADLPAEFPEMKGLSRRNLFYMRAFGAWPDLVQQAVAQLTSAAQVVQQPVAQLPWGHVTLLLDRLDDQALRDWYAEQAILHGWSRNVLLNQIMKPAPRAPGVGAVELRRHPAGRRLRAGPTDDQGPLQPGCYGARSRTCQGMTLREIGPLPRFN